MIVVREEQIKKTPSPRVVTESGIVMMVRDQQPSKSWFPTDVIDSEFVMLVGR